MPTPGPATQAAATWRAANPPPTIEPLHGWKNVLDTIGKVLDPQAEAAIRGGKEKAWETQLGNYDAAAKAEQGDLSSIDTERKTNQDIDTSKAAAGHDIAETGETNTREELERAEIGRPKLLTGDQDTATMNGERYQRYANPDGSTQWVKEGDTPRFTSATPQVGNAAAPGAPQNSSQGPGKIANPPTPAQQPAGGLPAGAVVGKQPVASPEEAAKLAPVGNEAQSYNQQVADAVGPQAGDFSVKPTDSRERADKVLADARAQGQAVRANQSAERVANAPAVAEKIKTEHNYGYSTDADGNVIYTTEANAANSGQVFEPVTAADVNKDRQALGLMGNVQLNSLNYKNAVNALPGPVSDRSRQAMEHILANPNLSDSALLKVADLGTINSIMNQGEVAGDWNKLSPPEQKAVTEYLRAKGAVIAYQRALTNQGRTNPEALMVEFDTIPVPFVGATVANPRFDSFQENIDQVASRLPKNLPGVSTVESVRNKVGGPKPAASSSAAPAGAGQGKPAKFVNGQWVDAATNQPIGAR